MKKIKWTMMTLAILLSVSAAFAFRPKPLTSGLYYYNGEGYLPAGTEGVNYVCEENSTVCTYYYSGGNYIPYQTAASYVPINLAPASKPAPAKEK